MSKNRIMPQMFDIRPVNADGGLDWQRISRLRPDGGVRPKAVVQKSATEAKVEEGSRAAHLKPEAEAWSFAPRNARRKPQVYVLGRKFESDSVPLWQEAQDHQEQRIIPQGRHSDAGISRISPSRRVARIRREEERITIPQPAQPPVPIVPKGRMPIVAAKKRPQPSRIKVKAARYFRSAAKSLTAQLKRMIDYPLGAFRSAAALIAPSRQSHSFSVAKSFAAFAMAVFLVASPIATAVFWNRGHLIKGRVLGVSQEGLDEIDQALNDFRNRDFDRSATSFNEACDKFETASAELRQLGSGLISVSRFIPFASRLSSGSDVIEAGKYFSQAGEELAKTTDILTALKDHPDKRNISYLQVFRETESHLESAQSSLKEGLEKVERVNVADLPAEKQAKFVQLKKMLPGVIDAVDTFLGNERIITDLLGGNGPRKYLFLFQNNQEMRATGGFIGSYGFLDMNDGRIREFYINGIFDPDGQLVEKIVPPVPIQKISAAWSLHDSNWFPDFPVSARKAITFYEKTGGPTVDGVITMTPTVLQRLLEITGPIEMPEYGVTLDSANFIELTQYEVEVDYDKELNQPKKILSDLAPLIIGKLFTDPELKTMIRSADVFAEALNQKQILVYSQNKDLQKLISDLGWSGEIAGTAKDYLAVINTNINGFKTDGVIEEEIVHEAEIQADGSIIDTVSIRRHHQGGQTGYQWWDGVNADYLRVYVPLGSELISVEGQTRETNEPPLDYDGLKFKRDPQVVAEEAGISIDQESGTRVYQDAGKTVFANWTYVSPQETMEIIYRYKLPFRVSLAEDDPAGSYSLLVQKQAGSLGSRFKTKVDFPRRYDLAWSYPEDLQIGESQVQFETVLETDEFVGAAFVRNNLIVNQ